SELERCLLMELPSTMRSIESNNQPLEGDTMSGRIWATTLAAALIWVGGCSSSSTSNNRDETMTASAQPAQLAQPAQDASSASPTGETPRSSKDTSMTNAAQHGTPPATEPVAKVAGALMNAMSPVSKAVAVIHPASDSHVMGTATFTESDGGVKVVADINGLSPGKHGFHIHEFGDCSDAKAASAGGH